MSAPTKEMAPRLSLGLLVHSILQGTCTYPIGIYVRIMAVLLSRSLHSNGVRTLDQNVRKRGTQLRGKHGSVEGRQLILLLVPRIITDST